jgi:sporulation protein YlmC with PRC-barrel domain
MRSTMTISVLLAATALSLPTFAQDTKPAMAPATHSTVAPATMVQGWRASKLIGVDVYNGQNEKVGDINEVLLDQSGKVTGFVIGVGGFLGMGEHDVLLAFDQVKFVNEPVKANTASMAPQPGATTGAAPTTTTTASDKKWYPDHALIQATKDQLKAMPQFKYN